MISPDPAGMRRISSRLTSFTKRLLPVALLAFDLMLVALALGMDSREDSRSQLLVIAAVMAPVGYIVWRKLFSRLVDEVWDAGQELVIRSKAVEDHVPLSAIMNISYVTVTNPQRVTLSLRQPTLLGKEITFLLPSRLIPFSRSPIVDDLIQRVDVARLR